MNILAISRAPLLSSEVCVSGAFNLIILSYPLGNFYCLPTPAALRLASSLRGKHPDATSLCDGYLRPTSSKGKTFWERTFSGSPERKKRALCNGKRLPSFPILLPQQSAYRRTRPDFLQPLCRLPTIYQKKDCRLYTSKQAACANDSAQ